MMTMTTMMATEDDTEPAPGRWRGSTRGRMLAWFILLMTGAIAGSLAVTANLLLAAGRDSIEDDIEREVSAFRSFGSQALDPETGEPFADAATLLTRYLTTAVPGEREFMFSVVGGKPGERTRSPSALRLDRDPTIVRAATIASTPQSGTTTTSEGLVAYAIVPVLDSEGRGGNALVIVEHMQPIIDETMGTVRSIGFVSALALLAASFLSWLVTAHVVAPLKQVLATAQEIDSGDLSRRIPHVGGAGNDVELLAHNFNRMLDRLEKAFATQREFLDDAAHELRTPLTVIRGNLELAGGRLGESERVLLLDEVDRMNRLVDDLLVLARSEQPDFLTFERVDVADLVLAVAAKSQFLAERRWGVPSIVSGTITADGQRLTQALMQLMANAVQATRAGDPIHLWSRLSDDGVNLELVVDDGGPGVPPEKAESIFTRFHGGRRDGTSSGLGLAIVRSIATAHGGRVRVANSTLEGARFVISLPIENLEAAIDGADEAAPDGAGEPDPGRNAVRNGDPANLNVGAP